jgi:hypothetical protein
MIRPAAKEDEGGLHHDPDSTAAQEDDSTAAQEDDSTAAQEDEAFYVSTSPLPQEDDED